MTNAELRQKIAEQDEEAAAALKRANKAELEKWLEDNGAAAEEKKARTPMAEALARHRAKYEPAISYKGAVTMDAGDEVAISLRGQSPETIIAIAELLLKFEPGTLAVKYAKLNPGQQRMNAGNRIRGAHRRGEITAREIAKTIDKVKTH